MDSMRAEMLNMTAASPEQMKSTMTAHRQLTANMLAQMNSDMWRTIMTGDPAWTAVVDSVRQDLVQLPDPSGAPLTICMNAHDARLERLMSMHREMTKMSGSK